MSVGPRKANYYSSSLLFRKTKAQRSSSTAPDILMLARKARGKAWVGFLYLLWGRARLLTAQELRLRGLSHERTERIQLVILGLSATVVRNSSGLALETAQ